MTIPGHSVRNSLRIVPSKYPQFIIHIWPCEQNNLIQWTYKCSILLEGLFFWIFLFLLHTKQPLLTFSSRKERSLPIDSSLHKNMAFQIKVGRNETCQPFFRPYACCSGKMQFSKANELYIHFIRNVAQFLLQETVSHAKRLHQLIFHHPPLL